MLNNLMLWHSSWALLIDSSSVKISTDLSKEFAKTEQFLRGFFLTKVIGYMMGEKTRVEAPFKVVRSRHKALEAISSRGGDSAEEAECTVRRK